MSAAAVDLDSISEPEPTREEAKAILAKHLPDVFGSLRDADGITKERDLDQARRILEVACRTSFTPWTFSDAAEIADRIVKLKSGADLQYLYNGTPNTYENRQSWLDTEQRDLNNRIRELTQRI